MKRIRIEPSARRQMRDIHSYSVGRWGTERADAYVRTLSAMFTAIAADTVRSRRIPAMFGVDGFVIRCESHFIYWRPLSDDAIAIVTVLHQRMHQGARIRAAFANSL